MKNKGIIYKVTHKESGRSYIGATTGTMKKRKTDHIQKAKKSLGGYFQNAIATQGPEAFVWTQIDTANSIDDLARKEKEYVIKYDSKENGYNDDSGGGFQKSVYQYSIEDRSLIDTFDCLESAANAVGAHKNSIAKVCSGENRTCKGYYWSYLHPIPLVLQDARKRTVVQMDLIGNVLTQYDSVAEASERSGLSKTCIARCCRGERKKSGGFLWKYA